MKVEVCSNSKSERLQNKKNPPYRI